jgi:hypothetical protein
VSEGDWFGIVAGVGLALVIGAGLRGWRWLRTVGWRRAEGVVESAAWRLEAVDDATSVHRLLVTYSYTVDRTRYASARVALGGRSFGSRASADDAVARYPQGARVTVFHDRHRPGDAVLERERLGWSTLALALAGILIMALGFWRFPGSPS